LSTAGQGIFRFDGKGFTTINETSGLSDDYVYQLAWFKEQLWSATDEGINAISFPNNQPVIRKYNSTTGIPDNIVKSLFPANEGALSGKLWFGMEDKGIGLADVLSGAWKYIKDWTFGSVNSLLSNAGELWMATDNNGIAIASLPDLSGTVTPTFPLRQFTKPRNLLKDAEGNIWFTSNDQLVRTNGSQLQIIISVQEQTINQAHTILADCKNNLWINNNTGLVRYSFDTAGATWKPKFLAVPGIDETTDITSLYEDKFGHIWMGTMGKGVIVLDPQTSHFRSVQEDHLLLDGSVLSINGRDNQVWISSLGGAALCTLTDANHDIAQPLKFENYNKQSGIGSNYVYSTFVDSKKRVWFATDGKGVTMLHEGKFYNYNERHGLKDLRIYSICEDKLGNIWFSTSAGGVYRFDGHSFTNISVEDGLLDATVTALETDAAGNIFAITQKGINIIDAATLSIAYLDANQGIEGVNTDLNCITTNTGHLYFICKTGIAQFTADYRSLQPRIVLDNMTLFLQDTDMQPNREFEYDENNISFFYTGISLSHPDKIKYQYKLEGFENQWYTTKDNYINFPKLPPGRYTFHVRASINNRFENAQETTYSFRVLKPIWWRWWFIVATMMAMGALVYLYIRQREKAAQRWERLEKEKIQSQFETLKSQVNPHFLFNSFNTLISVIEENPQNAVKYVEHLSDLYRKIVTYRDKETITLKEEIELIRDYFFIQQQRFGNNLQLNINISEEQQQRYRIAPLSLQLVTENAVKHNGVSASAPLMIHMSIQNDMLVTRNNINPKHYPEKSAGMGLQNITRRYELLSKQAVRVEHTTEYFVVYIPLLLA